MNELVPPIGNTRTCNDNAPKDALTVPKAISNWLLEALLIPDLEL